MGKAMDFIGCTIQTVNRPLLLGIIWIGSWRGLSHWLAASKNVLLGENNSSRSPGSASNLLNSSPCSWVLDTRCFQYVIVFRSERARSWKCKCGLWWLMAGACAESGLQGPFESRSLPWTPKLAMEEALRFLCIPRTWDQLNELLMWQQILVLELHSRDLACLGPSLGEEVWTRGKGNSLSLDYSGLESSSAVLAMGLCGLALSQLQHGDSNGSYL